MAIINSAFSDFKRRRFIWVTIILLIGMGLLKFVNVETKASLTNDHTTFEVKNGPLQTSVIEVGTINPRVLAIIKSEIESRATILTLVDEGTRVKKGDLLIELDASNLLEKKINRQIRVQNAEADFVSKREHLAIVEIQAQSNIDKARLAYAFAQQDLIKYKEGEYPNQLRAIHSKITLAKEEIIRAREKLAWSRKLYDEKYISKIKLQADELAEKKKVLDLELARNELNLLNNFTYKRKLTQLESDVKQAKMALDRTIRKSKASLVQAKAKLIASQAVFNKRKSKLKKIEKQIEKTKLYAPSDGLVVYATSVRRRRKGRAVEPLNEGQVVHEGQHLIYLPTTSSFKAEVLMHEAKLDKIRLGQPVKITVEALPGEIFTGRVAKIALLPNPQRAWLNPDLKVYNTDIYIEGGHESLRTGMTCKAEIIIDQYPSVTYIPVQAVLRIEGEPTVYVSENGTMVPRKVKIGMDNDRMVHVIDGLKPGEVVSLKPSLESRGA